MSNFFSKTITEAHEMAENQLATHNRIAEALETANLIAFYNTPSLYESLDMAPQYELQQQILQRVGAKHA